MVMEMYRDDYASATTDRDDFILEVLAVEEQSSWQEGIKGEDLKVISVLPIEVPVLADKYNLREDVLVDTADADGTQLILLVKDQAYCLGETGYAGLLQNGAGVSGPGLARLRRENSQKFCECLDQFFKVQPHGVKVFHSCDKVRGVLSANYRPMEIPALLSAAEAALADKMGEPEFAKGYVSHAFTSARYALPEANSEILDQYQNLLAGRSNVYGNSFSPEVSFYSSNTGAAAATLVPMLVKPNGTAFNIGKGVKIRHDNRQTGNATGCGGLEEFQTQAYCLFTSFKEGMERLGEMANHPMQHPQNAFVAACNWAFGERLPRRLAAAALDEFLTLSEGLPCTMYDVYMGITDIAAAAERSGMGFSRCVDINECIAKIPQHPDWDEFDLAGVVAWKGGAK